MSTAPDEAFAAVQGFCAQQVPDHLRDEVRMECSRRGRSITIVERRPPWKSEYGPEWTSLQVAQLRFDDETETWTLHWRDSSDRWHRYDQIRPAPTVAPLLAEIESDPTGIFLG